MPEFRTYYLKLFDLFNLATFVEQRDEVVIHTIDDKINLTTLAASKEKALQIRDSKRIALIPSSEGIITLESKEQIEIFLSSLGLLEGDYILVKEYV